MEVKAFQSMHPKFEISNTRSRWCLRTDDVIASTCTRGGAGEEGQCVWLGPDEQSRTPCNAKDLPKKQKTWFFLKKMTGIAWEVWCSKFFTMELGALRMISLRPGIALHCPSNHCLHGTWYKEIWNAKLSVCKRWQVTEHVACLFCTHYMCISAFRSIMTPFSHLFYSQGWHIKLALWFTAHKSNPMTTCTLVPCNLLPKGFRSSYTFLRFHSSYTFLRLSMFWYTSLSFRGTEKDTQYFPAHNLM